jgi:hypothetical protein
MDPFLTRCHGPERVGAQIRYNSRRAPCRVRSDAANFSVAVPPRSLAGGSWVTCPGPALKYQVSAHYHDTGKRFSSAGAAGLPRWQSAHLICGEARIKRPDNIA